MKPSVFVLFFVVIFVTGCSQKGSFTIGPRDYSSAAIICPGDDAIKRFAADELQKHLFLLTGYSFPIVAKQGTYSRGFFVGIRSPHDSVPFEAEEARYKITRQGIYLYGDDRITREMEDYVHTATLTSLNRAGTLFAVYNFLENELGVRWYEPGDEGILYERISRISIPLKVSSWSSHFTYQRGMRSYTWNYKMFKENEQVIPEPFRMTEEEVRAKKLETDIWLRRMRMGNKNTYLPFSHSFTDWWGKYGKEHPEWFALNGMGERAPLTEADRIKMCPSNQQFVDKIVDVYVKKEDPKHVDGAIDATENDGGGRGLSEFCHCDQCVALDHLKPGESFGANLTDRYVNFWARIADEAIRHDPDVVVTGYAYSIMLTPPRKERLHRASVIEFVSGFNEDFSRTDSLFSGWEDMGMKQMLFRPNDLCCDLGLPLGQERRVFDHQQIALKHHAAGTDHDCIYGFWTGISGINYYILAKSHIDPSKPFEYWENEYCALFGRAGKDIRKYFTYWRDEVFTKRLLPADEYNRKTEKEEGLLAWRRVGAYGRDVEKYYRPADFDLTDKYLQDALKRKLTPVQKRMVDRLVIANHHNRLTYQAMLTKAGNDKVRALAASKTLLGYRIQHKDDLYMNWPLLFREQVEYGDVCGMANLLFSDRQKVFNCLKVASGPQIDGRLSESFWPMADTKTPFVLANNSAEPQAQTSTCLAYDDEKLYIAYTCYEPRMDLVKENVHERDGEVYNDNAVELFFDAMNTGKDYKQIVISSSGALFDGESRNGSYSPDFNLETGKDITVAILKNKESWTIEISITFSSLGMKSPAAGNNIHFNLCRTRLLNQGIANENSSLAALFSNYSNPSRFVTLVF